MNKVIMLFSGLPVFTPSHLLCTKKHETCLENMRTVKSITKNSPAHRQRAKKTLIQPKTHLQLGDLLISREGGERSEYLIFLITSES